MLIPFADHVIQLIGADSAKEKRLALQNLQSMPTSESLVIVATGKYVGEGFDYPRLDTLFLTMPIAWKGNVEQYAGRLHREYAGKNEVRIYDYVDVWRKRSIPTHSEWLYPLTFDAGKGLKEA